MLSGYDIDGVLVPLRVVPRMPFVIISGRLPDTWEITMNQIGGYNVPIYLRPFGTYGDLVAAARWKAQIINHLGVEEFHEDDEHQVAIIRSATNCKVIHVR